jgi:D-3-phosphoglycerate dehydrogenase / 2-oxoglutarate reductase
VEGIWGEALAGLRTRYEVRATDAVPTGPAALTALVSDVQALVVRNRTQVDTALLEDVPSLRVVARAGVELDNIDLAAANQIGVVVVAALGLNVNAVAEHALALAMSLARGTVRGHLSVVGGGWERRAGVELRGRTWGLIGAGATGRATGALARSVGMTVVAHDPVVDLDDPALRGIRMGGSFSRSPWSAVGSGPTRAWRNWQTRWV